MVFLLHILKIDVKNFETIQNSCTLKTVSNSDALKMETIFCGLNTKIQSLKTNRRIEVLFKVSG